MFQFFSHDLLHTANQVLQLKKEFRKLPAMKATAVPAAGDMRDPQLAHQRGQTKEQHEREVENLTEQRSRMQAEMQVLLERQDERKDLLAVLQSQPDAAIYHGGAESSAKLKPQDQDLEIGMAQMRTLMSMKAPRQPGLILEKVYLPGDDAPSTGGGGTTTVEGGSAARPPPKQKSAPSALFATTAPLPTQSESSSQNKDRRVVDLSPVSNDRREVLENML